MSMYDHEQVLVVPRALFDALGSFQGLSTEIDRYLPAILAPASNFFLSRDLAENDPTHKQIIPYAVFHHGGRFLHYVRGRKSGEQRLASKGSIGIGGHINRDDAHASSVEKDTYMTGVEREVNEELRLKSAYRQRTVALINDDSTEVGAVHLGVVHLFDLDSPEVAANEANIVDLGFLDAAALEARRDSLETWSQICLPALGGWVG